MLVLPAAGLVILENPKTATQSLRAMLRQDAVIEPPRHAAQHVFAEREKDLALRFGTSFETVTVVRHPLDRARSWHRYRQRPGIDGLPHSAANLDFDAFLRAVLLPKPPPYARIGRQDRFVGWDGREAAVDYIFDYARLDRLVAFLAGRLGRRRLVLPHRNASPPSAPDAAPDGEAVALYEAARADEFALHSAVAAAGMLVRGRTANAG